MDSSKRKSSEAPALKLQSSSAVLSLGRRTWAGILTVMLTSVAGTASAGTVNYNTTGSILSCNGVSLCTQNSDTSVTVGGVTLTYNAGSGSGVVTPSYINLGNIVSTGVGAGGSLNGLSLKIRVNSTPPGSGDVLPSGALNGTLSTNSSSATIVFSPNNTSTNFGTFPGIVISGGGVSLTYQLLNTTLYVQAPIVGNPIGQTSIQGAVTDTSGPLLALPPVLTKTFADPVISFSPATTLTFTVSNPNLSGPATGIGFTDTLPAGLAVSTPNSLSGSCGGGIISASNGGSVISLSGATLGAGSSCSFSVSVTALPGPDGTLVNTTSPITSINGGTGAAASASIFIMASLLNFWLYS